MEKDSVTQPITVSGTHHTGLSLLKAFSSLRFAVILLSVRATTVSCSMTWAHRGITVNDASIHTEDDAEVFLYGGEREQRHSLDPLPYISAEPASSSEQHIEVPRGSSAAPVFGGKGSSTKF